MDLDEQIEAALNELEALYFFSEGLSGNGGEDIRETRAHFRAFSTEVREGVLAEINSDILGIREHYGALSANGYYQEIREQLTKANSGLGYLSKLIIDHLFFSHYENVFPRWPHVREHAFVIFDPKTGILRQLFELDGQLFHDAQFLLQKARQVQGNAARQRDLSSGRHRVLHTLLRPLVTTLFTFLEAYLNGIAYDCFHKHHDALDLSDHDLLAEWDSLKKRRRFVDFDQKVFKYPSVVARIEGREIDMSGMRAAHNIVRNGKELRDALTHPSAQYDVNSNKQKKVGLFAGLTLPLLESIYGDMVMYVQFVEQGIGHNPTKSIPWLFDDYGFKLGNNEAI